MEDNKNGSSMFGTILVMIILVGIVIYYLSNKNAQNEPAPENETSTSEVQMTQEQNTLEAGVDLESEINSLDTNFEDMNAEDLGI